MTLAETDFPSPRAFLPRRQILPNLRFRRRAMCPVAHLDDRLRADIGLTPRGEPPLSPHEAAARIALMAWR